MLQRFSVITPRWLDRASYYTGSVGPLGRDFRYRFQQDTENQTIKAEHDSFFQAVYNLFDNAVKFTEEGGTITVYMAEVNGRLQFNIINTGSQIPQDKIKFVFDRFYKGDTSRNRNSSGSGLGLYITKTVVKQHGGDIFVRSNDNKTEFCFTIPLNR